MALKLLKVLTAAAAGCFGLSVLFNAYLILSGGFINLSSSLPDTFYRKSEKDEIERGSLLLLCLEEKTAVLAFARGYLGAGRCPGRTAPVGKKLLALEGDLVVINEQGISVNGRLLKDTRPQRLDSAGQELPSLHFAGKLKEGQLIVGNLQPDSFDSRYFGVVLQKQVLSRIEAF